MFRRSDWCIIGISGVTCGGKTTLATKLCAAVLGARVLHQDHYFLPDQHPRHVRVPGLDHNNYDVLTALDMKRMHRDALSILSGAEGGECGGGGGGGGPTLRLPGRRVLVLEGFSVLNYRPLYDLCDLKYYFVLEYGECAARRALRLYEPPDVAGYFELCVWPEHLQYRAAIEKDPTVVVLDGARHDAFERVTRDLRARGALPDDL